MKTALIVIDMQNDYLYKKRKKQFSYDTEKLVNSVNALINEYHTNGCDVIYIRHIIQNLPTNKLLFGYSIYGTEGAELYGGLDIVSDYCFDKLVGDALSNRNLLKMIKEKDYNELHLCGLDEYGCVKSTALGANRRKIGVAIIKKGTATVFPEKKILKWSKKLKEAKIRYI